MRGTMQQQHDRVDEPLCLGDRGLAVLELRRRLRQLDLLPHQSVGGTEPADVFDEACDRAVRSFQQQRGLRIDGVVDRETYRGLDEARWRLGDRPLSFAVRHPYVGDDVAGLQHRLIDMGFDCGRADGVFGPRTENALREFQRNVGLPADGACGPATFRALRQLAKTVVGGKANELREYERLHHGGPTMAGKLVVIDPGHGGLDRGSTNGVLDEAGIVDDIANRVEGRLAAAGALAWGTRGGEGSIHGPGGLEPVDRPPSDADRGAFANAAEADLLVSIHVDGHANPECRGVSTYYYGTANDRSLVGARLAELIQQEVLSRTDLLDCRSHPKTWELLRRTRMPAVRIELGYLTNPGDAARLGRPEFRDELAEAIVVAIQRLFSPAELPSRESVELSRQTISV
jgi:N-acetylmuramoyl-L-alanine amidase